MIYVEWLVPALLVLTLPENSNAESFDHHDLPLDAPDPFAGMREGSARVDQIEGACREPEPPLVDPASLAALGLSRREEYVRYFDEANAYLMCLERTRLRFIEDVRRHGEMFDQGSE